MKPALALLILACIAKPACSQKIDSIAFHLYTDSLKKGRHNYINVDGFIDGHWLPLTSKEIQFSSSVGTFEGNDLVVPAATDEKKILVKAVLKSAPAVSKEIFIWIKTLPEPARLPTQEEILKRKTQNKKKDT